MAPTIAPPRARVGGYSFTNVGGKEYNFVDTTVNQECDTTGAVTLLNGVAAGTSASQRIGRKINIRSIAMNLRLVAKATTTISDCRIVLVWDTQTNAAAPAITDIYDAINATSMRNISNGSRFRILRVWEEVIIGNSATPASGQEARIFKDWRLCNFVTTYNAGGGATVGDITTGGYLS